MAKRKVNWSVSEEAYDQLKMLSLYHGTSVSKLIEDMTAYTYQLNMKKIIQWQRQTLQLGD